MNMLVQSTSLAKPHQYTSTQKYQQSGRDNPCPICQRTKDADCRWNSEVVFCHTHKDGTDTLGYTYRGTDDIWGIYFPENSKPIRPKGKKEFVYQDSDGKPVVKVTRTDDGKGTKKIWQSHWNGKQWNKGCPKEVRANIHLYKIEAKLNQDAIANGEPVLLVEGEGKVDQLLEMDIAATCAIGGAGKWHEYGFPNYLKDLDGAKVVLCPDRDEPGIQHCEDIAQDVPDAQWLYVFPESPLWHHLPKNNGLDIADWISDQALTRDQILAAIEPKRDLTPKPSTQTHSNGSSTTVLRLLLQIAEQGDYFHTPGNVAYVDIKVGDTRKTFRLDSKAFKMWLYQELFKQHSKALTSEPLKQVLMLLEAKACFDGETREVHLRTAEHEGKVYIDLGTDDWNAIEVTTEGWSIIDEPPVRFRRPDAQLPLPIPSRDGSITHLRDFLNMADDAWALTISWLLFSLYPNFPHPLLLLHGERGTGKTSAARLLKSLVDPGRAPMVPSIADPRNLAIMAENRWLLVYDNLSYISDEKSDALCRISTGGGFSTRTLHSNDEETVFEFIRPQILTGIGSLASRGDLMERCLMAELMVIPEDERLGEQELERRLTPIRGSIFGALLTALSQTLKALPDTNPDRLPRMADFARFAIAAEPTLGLAPGSFMDAYDTNQQEAHEAVLESEPLAIAIIRLMETREQWQGNATELIEALTPLMPDETLKSKKWPGTPPKMGKAIPRVSKDLRYSGIDITRPQDGPRRAEKKIYIIQKNKNHPSHPAHPSQAMRDKGFNSDGLKSNPSHPSPNPSHPTSHPSQTPSPVTPPVTTETIEERGFQASNDGYDGCDGLLTPISFRGVDSENAPDCHNEVSQPKRETVYVKHKEYDTVVELIRQSYPKSQVNIPGFGSRWVDNSLLDFSTITPQN